MKESKLSWPEEGEFKFLFFLLHLILVKLFLQFFPFSPENGSSCSGGHGEDRSPQILAKAVQVHPEMLKGMYFA